MDRTELLTTIFSRVNELAARRKDTDLALGLYCQIIISGNSLDVTLFTGQSVEQFSLTKDLSQVKTPIDQRLLTLVLAQLESELHIGFDTADEQDLPEVPAAAVLVEQLNNWVQQTLEEHASRYGYKSSESYRVIKNTIISGLFNLITEEDTDCAQYGQIDGLRLRFLTPKVWLALAKATSVAELDQELFPGQHRKTTGIRFSDSAVRLLHDIALSHPLAQDRV